MDDLILTSCLNVNNVGNLNTSPLEIYRFIHIDTMFMGLHINSDINKVRDDHVNININKLHLNSSINSTIQYYLPW